MCTYLKLLTFNSIGMFFVLCTPLILAANASGAEAKLETNETSLNLDIKQSAKEERPNVEFDQNKPEGQALDYAISAEPKEYSSLRENISTNLLHLSSLSFSKLNNEDVSVQPVKVLSPDNEDRKESATRKNTGDRAEFALELTNQESLSNSYINANSSHQLAIKSNHLSVFSSSEYAQKPAESSSDINKLLVEGDQYLAKEEYQKAAGSFNEALSRFETDRNQFGMVKALSGKTAVELGLGQYEQAQGTAVQALALLQKVNKKYPDIEADILIRAGYAYLGLEKSSDVETTVKQVSPIVDKLPASDRAAGLLVSLADLQYAIGQKDSGNQSAQKAVSFLQSNPDPTGAIAILSRLAVSQYASEKPDETAGTLDRITQLVKKLKEQPKRISLLQGVGGLYLKLGESENLKPQKSGRAIQLFEKARQAFEEADSLISAQDSKTEVNVGVLLGFGRAYVSLNRNEEAVGRAEQALEIIQSLENAAGIQAPKKKSRSIWEQIGCGLGRLVTKSSTCDEEDAELAVLNQPDTVFKRMKRDAYNIIAAARLDQNRYVESDASLREALKMTRQIDGNLSNVSKTIRQIQGLSGIIAVLPLGFVSEFGSYINTTASGLDQVISLPQGGFLLLDKINSDMINSSKKRNLDDLKKQQEEARLQHNASSEAEILLQLGSGYLGIGRYSDASGAFKDAATLFSKLNQSEQLPRDGKETWAVKEAEALLGSGRSLYLERNYADAQKATQQAAAIFKAQRNTLGYANTWLTLGNISLSQSNFLEARGKLQTALVLFSEVKDDQDAQIGRANTLLALGTVSLRQRKYKDALNNAEAAIGIFQVLRNETESARARLVRGSAYQALGDHRKALEDAQKALFIFKDRGDRLGESSALNNIGDALQSQRRYEQAIRFYGLSAELQKDLQQYVQKPKPKTGWLVNVFRVSSFFLPWVGALGQTGLKVYNALSIAQSVVYLSESATAGVGEGFSYLSQGEYKQAMDAFDYVRKASEKQDPQKEAEALLGLSNTRLSFDQEYDMARKDAERSAGLFSSIGDRAGIAYALLAQGISHNRLGKFQSDPQKRTEHFNQASDAFQQAIATFQDPEILDLGGEAQAYSALADLMVDQNQEGAAIAFYKKSIQITEKIRQEIPDGKLSTAYVGNIADTYRRLIELLLPQARVPEAQQVLELLKLQEINTSSRVKIRPDGTLEYTKLEQQVLGAYKSFIELGQKIAKCGSDCSLELKNQRNALSSQYEEQVRLLKDELAQRSIKDELLFKPDTLNSKAKRIFDPCPWLIGQGLKCTPTEKKLRTMLIYPFVGEDKKDPSKYKLWLLWAGTQGVSVTIERSIDRKQFETEVFRFYDLLSNRENLGRRKELETVSAQLYDWLVKPLENELEKGKINNLVFALDRFIRYIPMAALFDKQSGKYLIQKGYKVSTIISVEATNVGDRLASTKDVKVLAMGLTTPKPNFNPLSNVKPEIQSIVRKEAKDTTGIYPGLPLYDGDFTLENLQKEVEKYRILHLATHGEFVAGNSDASYLVLGAGDEKTLKKLTAQEIDEKLSYELTNVHLVVLSACQTGLGGKISQVNDREKSEGIEIPGLSYSFMRGDRAKAVIASLWSVNDASTARLMQLFYANLANTKEPMTKAEALRRAQLSLLSGKSAPVNADGTRSNFNIQLPPGAETNVINRDLSHPYYWAPFILIGNGL